MECIILSGIQASGKSTFYKRNLEDTHLRLNLDMLGRRSREFKIFEACVKSGTKIVIDNTNTLKTEREKYILLLKKYKYKIIGYAFDNNLNKCLRRNILRKGNAQIPIAGVMNFYDRYQSLEYSEGFDEIYDIKDNDIKYIIKRR